MGELLLRAVAGAGGWQGCVNVGMPSFDRIKRSQRISQG